MNESANRRSDRHPRLVQPRRLAARRAAARRDAATGSRFVCRTATLTYDDVAAHSRRFANVLVGLGLRPEERVFLALPDGADFVGALFGVLRAGAVVVMLNPGARRRRGRSARSTTCGPRFAVIDGRPGADLRRGARPDARARPRLVTVGRARARAARRSRSWRAPSTETSPPFAPIATIRR